MSLNQRILDELKRAGKTQSDLADKLNVSRATISERLNNSKEIDSLEFLRAVAQVTGIRLLDLMDEAFTKSEMLGQRIVLEPYDSMEVNDNSIDYLKGKTIRPITVTVDRAGKELIAYVPVKAQAGYPKGFGDAHYMEKLPSYSLPILKSDATYRMFQVDGDSMLQLGGGGLHDGDVVIAKYVEDIYTIKDNRVYVVVCSDGVRVKRVINRFHTPDKLIILKSDNKNGQHRDKLVRSHEILEVWELTAFISKQLNFSTDLWEMINELRAEQAVLHEKMSNMDKKK